MRPYPPIDLVQSHVDDFRPAPDLEEWVTDTFINEGAPLENPDHQHLRSAHLGFLWTNVENARRGRRILGTCQIMPPQGEPWGAGRAEFQLRGWFGAVPDFLITIHANSAMEMGNAEFMALIEHELYHAGQAKDEFGQPKFSKLTGRPIFTTRPHDIEEFVGVVARYGADAAGVRAMVAVANKGPSIAEARIDRSCGTCLRLVK